MQIILVVGAFFHAGPSRRPSLVYPPQADEPGAQTTRRTERSQPSNAEMMKKRRAGTLEWQKQIQEALQKFSETMESRTPSEVH